MEPTIATGSTCLVLKSGVISVAGFELFELAVRNDMLVVAQVSGRKRHVIKRVAGVAGQRLAPASWLDRLRLTKNAAGKRVSLPGVQCTQEGCQTAQGYVFLISEQLKGSSDSRHFGAVRTQDVIGRIAGCW